MALLACGDNRPPRDASPTTTGSTSAFISPRSDLGVPGLDSDVTDIAPHGVPQAPLAPTTTAQAACPPAPRFTVAIFTAEPNLAARPNRFWIVDVRGRIDNPGPASLRGIDLSVEVTDSKGELTREIAGIRDGEVRIDPFIDTVEAGAAVEWGYYNRTYPGDVPEDRPRIIVAHLRYSVDEPPACLKPVTVSERKERQQPA